jgi:TolB-like protein/Flp pilus assembly protein TadD
MAQPGFFEELRRRHVWRVAAAYAITSWLLVQIATQVFPIFHMPDWTVQIVVVLVALGFPIAVIFAWVYEITPEGMRRTVPADSPDSRPEVANRQIARKLNTVIIAMLVLAVALLGWRLLVMRRTGNTPEPKTIAPAHTQTSIKAIATAASRPAPAAFRPPADTLVVLPFANLGGDPKQQYFSDGITEELTNALGQNTGLRVIAWDTASKFRSSQQTAADIGKQLDVANVLTGKILRQGDEVRVIVELVNTRNGYQVWASHYDDSLVNIFQVQDKISAAIATALKVKFAATPTKTKVDPQALDLVLKARSLTEKKLAAAPLEQARRLLQQAIALDPDYADAHALLARVWFDLTQVSTLSLEDALPAVREEANRALALNPRNVDARVALGNVAIAEVDHATAKSEFERALAIDPSYAVAHLDYGNVLPPQQALMQYQKAARLDPENATAQNNLEVAYQNLDEYRQALAPALALSRLTPHSADAAFGLALTYALLHRNEDAAKAFDGVQPDTELGRALVNAGRLAYRSVLHPGLHAQALATMDTLHERPDVDPTSMYDMIQLYLVLGRNDTALDLLPKFCASIPVGCDNLGAYPTWLPLHGDPRFEALVKKYDTTSQPSASATQASSDP